VKRAADEELPTQTAEVAERPAPLAAIVRIVEGEGSPSELRLEQGSCIIGSSKGCDIVIGVTTVSRRHLELSLVREGVLVHDLGSRNGTFLGGNRIERMVLGLGGRITVGPTTLQIDVDNDALHAGPASADGKYRGILGSSDPMRSLFGVLRRLEGSLVTVLVEGDSGVGKERVARALHDGSVVSEGPFIALNCGAIARELVGSELFGHRRGAFSGAHEARKGAFRTAHGGSLFLDEIGELPLDQQPALLRAIDLGEVRSLGEDQPTSVRVRVIAATNRDLEADVAAGRFRRDLFYRLAVVRLRVPALSERRSDIAPLARYFAEQQAVVLPEATIAELESRNWPGNVRELRNAVLAYAALGQLPSPPVTDTAELGATLAGWVDLERPYADQKDALTSAFTQAYLQALMARAQGNQSEAARISGLHRNHLARLLAKHGLSRDEADDSG
jgi:DNA-binding NtrC family response regulator